MPKVNGNMPVKDRIIFGAKTTVTCAIEEITPEIAVEMLGRNTRNRSLKKTAVNKYVRDMADGNWQINGESIKVAQDGSINDGQHRLAAVVESGVTIRTCVVRGLRRETQDTVDSGNKRTLGDVLKIAGEPYSNDLGATVRAVAAWYRTGTLLHSGANSGCSTKEGLATLDAHPEIRQAVTFARHVGDGLDVLPRALTATLYFVFSQVDTKDAATFFERLNSGTGLDESHPIYVLRERLLRDKSKPRGVRLPAGTKTAFAVKTWNAWRTHRSITVLKWLPDEDFPAIDGLTD